MSAKDVEGARAEGLGFRPTDEMWERSETEDYWSYGLDDIIANDIGRQIDLVRKVTNSQQVSILSFSLSTPTTMAFLAAHKLYARNVNAYFQMGPAIGADHLYLVDKIYFEKLCPHLATRGIGFTPTYFIKPLVRKSITSLSKSFKLRYSIIRNFLTSLFGPSQKYNTLLERNVLSHIFEPVSFKSVQHYCQNSLNKRLTHFDYGSRWNMIKYGQFEAPDYDLRDLQVQNWIVVSGTNDGLADMTTVQRLMERTRTPKPPKHIVALGYNHMDLLAGVEVDKYVNLPIMHELDQHSSGAK